MKKKIIIAGVDEVGRGCLAGPVVSAAVILKEGVNLEILWEFDDVREADKSLLKDMNNGTYDRALGLLEDQKYSRFNDYIEDLNGFSNSDITLNGRTFF